MSRKVMRVPLGFDYPLNVVWIGYENPYGADIECEYCQGSGNSPFAQKLKDQWWHGCGEPSQFHPLLTGSIPFVFTHSIIYQKAEKNIRNDPRHFGTGEIATQAEAVRLCGLYNKSWQYHLNQDDVDALLEADRLPRLTEDGHIPTVQEVNDWSIDGFGHDSYNASICIKARCEENNYDYYCQHCEGEGILWSSQAYKWLVEKGWQRIDPPTGEGFQLWEAVTAGSPISPVFKTKRDLAAWMYENYYGDNSDIDIDQVLLFVEAAYVVN